MWGGAFARRSGKTVRALHLYEELGLLKPVHRTKGGFRLYAPSSLARVEWIGKLNEAGFSLHELQDFLHAVGPDSVNGHTAPTAMRRVRDVFGERLAQIRAQLARLSQVESDLVESLDYLEGCRPCASAAQPSACGSCGEPGHIGKSQPLLVAGLQRG